MRASLRWLLGFTIGLGMTTAAVAVSTRADTSAMGTQLGRLNMSRYCTIELGQGAAAVFRSGSQARWVCRQPGGQLGDEAIDPDHACEVLYGPPAYSTAQAEAGQVTWKCFRGPAP